MPAMHIMHWSFRKAHIQHVHPLFRHVGGSKVLDVVHHVQVGEKAIPELHIKISHLVGLSLIHISCASWVMMMGFPS